MSKLSKSNFEAQKPPETLLGIGFNPTLPVKRSRHLQDQSPTKETAALKFPLTDKKKKKKKKKKKNKVGEQSSKESTAALKVQLSHKKKKNKVGDQSSKESTAALKVPLSDRNEKNNVDELPTSDGDEELFLPTNCLPIKTKSTELYTDHFQTDASFNTREDEDQEEESAVFLAEQKSRKVLVVQNTNNAKDLDIIKNSTKPKSNRGVYDRTVLNCSKCDKIYYKETSLDKHKREVHEQPNEPKEQEEYKCTFEGCKDKFKSKRRRTFHVKMMHSDSGDVNEQKPNLICHHCLKKLSTGKALQVHLKRHLQIKKFICKKCGAAKVTATELLVHMRSHEDIGTFKCPLCPNLLKHKSAVTRHVRLIHNSVANKRC